MRILCIFSFIFFLRYIVLVHEVLWPFIDIHCTYFIFYIVDVCFSFIYPFMCCFFSLLCTCFLLLVWNLLFQFHTKMSWWVLFKVFQKYRLSKSTCHKLSSRKVFQEFVLGYILLYSASEYELNDLWLLSYVHLFVVVLSRIAKGGDC